MKNPVRTGPLTNEQRHLVSENLGLAYKLVQKHAGTVARLGRDDVEQHALLALCHAARTFDPSRGTRFSTHAYTAIRFQLIELAGKAIRDPHRNVLDKLAERASDEPDRGLDVIGCLKLLRWLTPKQRYIVESIYMDGRSASDVARSLFMSRGTVVSLAQRALVILRYRMGLKPARPKAVPA